MKDLAEDLPLVFESLLTSHAVDKKYIQVYWEDVRQHYEEPHRHYHNLNHLRNLLAQLTACKSMIEDWDSVVFAMFYHDIIYDVKRHDNEEQSARVAEQVLSELKFQPERMHRSAAHILATKGHTISADMDTCFFIDADLSVLGSDAETYRCYSDQIRKEYSIYADAEYRVGRTKVLNHMLQLPALFKTPFFKDQLETQARKNLAEEINMLTSGA